MESIADESMVNRYFPCVVLPGPLHGGRQPALRHDYAVGGQVVWEMSEKDAESVLSVTVGHGQIRRFPVSPWKSRRHS